MRKATLIEEFKKALQHCDQEYKLYCKKMIAKELYDMGVKNDQHIRFTEKKNLIRFIAQNLEIILHAVDIAGEYVLSQVVVTEEHIPVKIVFCITEVQLNRSKAFQDLLACKISREDIFLAKERYKVIFVSPFSYGKSTLINALIGEKILETDIRAETANIAKLVYGEYNRIFAKSASGEVEVTVYQNIGELKDRLVKLTSARQEGNYLVEIIVEIQATLEKDIMIIDSPGLFSRYQHHDSLCISALEQGDLVVFLVDPARTGESNYTEFLKKYLPKLWREKKDFLFVISKRDLYDSAEEKKIEKELRIVLEELEFEDADVFFVSAYQGMLAEMVLNKKMDWRELSKDKSIFVEEDGYILRGREIKEYHAADIFEYSQIAPLRKRIIDSKNLYYRA